MTATAQIGEQYLDTVTRTRERRSSRLCELGRARGAIATASYGLTLTQTLFNGFQNGSRTRQAEAQVLAARETLRTTEQAVLLAAATAYMNLLRDSALLGLQRNNVDVLEATLRQTRDRFAVGEVTRTDLAQSESSPGRPAARRRMAAQSRRTTSRRRRPTFR